MQPEANVITGRPLGAGVWAIGSRLIAKMIDLAMLLCLARFLGPSEFGLVAVAMAAVFVVEALFELPTAAALIRLPILTPALLNTAFTLGLIRGLLVSFLLLLASVPLASFNNDSRLIGLIAVLSLAPALRGLVSPRLVEYTRRLDFRPDAVLELSGKLLAFVAAISVAVFTRSYWAIAAATVCAPMVSTFLSYVIAPLRPRLTLKHWSDFSNLIGWNFVAQLCSALNWQIDRIILPMFNSIGAFGQYAMAKQVSEIPIQALVAPLSRPTMAALASAGNCQGDRYLHISQAVSMMLVPVLGIPILWPEALIKIGLGPAWTTAAEWLRWISAAAVVSIPAMLLGPLAMTLNRTRWLATRTAIELIVRAPLVWVGAVYYGIPGAIAGGAVANFSGSIIGIYAVRSLVGVSYLSQLMALCRPLLALMPAAGILWFARINIPHDTNFLHFLILTSVCIFLYSVVYLLAILLIWFSVGRPAGAEKFLIDRVSRMLSKGLQGSANAKWRCN